ncbi:MAG TPA: choice-of-anchor tandem repeat GloVer-containing protein [Terriglobales bacterium]|nr:choice-of-anchor tandem repeat GloVer-containing protein [Terriglobales bacterium]
MRHNVSVLFGKWSAHVALSMVLASASLASSFKVIYSFGYNSPQGSVPFGDQLVFDAKGNLYGTTSGGGNLNSCHPQGCGTVFELSPSSKGWTETVLHQFDWYNDGEGPYYNLVLDPQGNLYGVVTAGPPGYEGAVFELSPGSVGQWTETILWKFAGGKTPHSGYVRDSAGNLYGNSDFTDELSPLPGGQWKDRTIAKTGSPATLTLKDGNLYDAAGGLGKYSLGMAYELTPAQDGSWQQIDLYDFKGNIGGGSDGAGPSAGVVFDSKGNLYGATGSGGTYSNACWQYGGEFGCGTVYKLTPTTHGQWKETVLHRFKYANDGFGPGNTLTIDKAGNLYGVAAGGINGYGILFKLSPGTNGKWNYSVLHRFTDAKDDGAWPDTVMVFDKQQKHLYGTTEYGGTYNSGTVFEITP